MNPSLRICTWNVNSIKVRITHLLKWLEIQAKANTPIDVICLQELKLTSDKFPLKEIEQAGYYSLVLGQKTYNGVAILVRKSMLSSLTQDPETAFLQTLENIPGFEDEQQRVLTTTLHFNKTKPLRIVCGYFPNGQALDSDKFVYKLAWLNALHQFIQKELAQHERLILLGDFNIAPKDEDVYDPMKWIGQNLVSPEERSAFFNLLSLGLHDSFLLFEQAPKSFSWWDYRMMGFRRNAGMRIDHILVSQALLSSCSHCEIDKTPRAWEQPSDHAPVILTLTNQDNKADAINIKS
ncbi:MAG: exodeoxyribonuclease III [Betaproteobacteria bacterium]